MKSIRQFLCVLALNIMIFTQAWSLEAVTLQLKWQHQFQFAGYYAALSQGYYREAGLDVSLREAQPYEDPVQFVLEGHAEFGVGTSELLLLHHLNQPVVVLAVILQHSPLVLIVPRTADSSKDLLPFQYIQSLHGKPVMMEPSSAELLAYLAREGLTRKRLNLVDHTFDIQDMLSGKVAAMSAYISDEPYLLQKENIDHQLFKPIMGGIDFYGDNLFTTQAQLDKYPKRVQAFRETSLKGWTYAMANPDEIIDLIINQYGGRHSREHLMYEYEQMRLLMRPDLIEVGYMYEGRWRHMVQTFAQQSMLPSDYNFEGFMYEPDSERLNVLIKNTILIACLILIPVLVSIAIFSYFNRALRKRAQWLNSVLSHIPSAFILLDQDAKIIRWNSYAASIFGWSEKEVKGKILYEFLIPLPNLSQSRELFRRVLSGEEGISGQQWCYTKSGKLILTDWNNARIQSNRMIAMISDITKQKELEDRLNQMAHSDALTGVANRTLFFQKLDEAISLAKRRKEKVALLFIDLDDFKIVNDQYGHEFGDVVLCEVVQRIKMAVREADMLARIGGDEFVLILHDCETHERATQVAEKVLFHLERPIYVSGITVVIGGSIGISFFPDNGSKTAELLKSANRAMYNVKQKQKNGVGLAIIRKDH